MASWLKDVAGEDEYFREFEPFIKVGCFGSIGGASNISPPASEAVELLLVVCVDFCRVRRLEVIPLDLKVSLGGSRGGRVLVLAMRISFAHWSIIDFARTARPFSYSVLSFNPLARKFFMKLESFTRVPAV
jgi:hypothetical protein